MLIDNILRRGFCFARPESEGASEPGEITEGPISDDDIVSAGDGKGDDSEPTESHSGGGDDPEVAEGGDDDTVDDGSLASRVAQKSDLSKVWEEHGLTGLPSDPAELQQRYQQAMQLQTRNQELQQQLLWQAHNYRQQQEQAQQAQFAAQRQQQQAPAAKIFELPEYDENWLSMVYTDENGNMVAKPGADPSLPQMIKKFASAEQKERLRFFRDPQSVMQPMFNQFAQQVYAEAERRSQALMYQYHETQQLKSFEKENASWVFADGKGGALTPAAETFNRYYAEAKQFGHPQAIDYAKSRLDAELVPYLLEQQATAAKAAKLPATNKDKDRAFIKNAASRQASRTGGQANGTTRPSQPKANGAFPRNRLLQQIGSLPPGDLDRI